MSILSDSLRTQLIPWSQQNASERFIVSRPKMSAAQMPDGVVLKRRKIMGERVIVKNRREYGNVRQRIADWPDAHLQEWEHYKLVCVLAGQIDYQVGRYSVQCGKGFFLVIPPRTPEPDGVLSYHAKGGSCDLLNIILHSRAVQGFITHAQDGRKVEFVENYLFSNVKILEMFRMFMEEIFDNKTNSPAISRHLLAAFFASMQREVDEERYINPGPIGRPQTLQPKTPQSDFKAELTHFVQTHVNQNLTLEKVSRGMYISRAQFVRRIRQETGKTFVQFLTDYRIEEAKVLLRDSEWTVTAIASFLGFASNNYFQTVFRTRTGKTPGQYRSDVKN